MGAFKAEQELTMEGRGLFVIGVLVTVLSIALPIQAAVYSGGGGTPADPYQIASTADLVTLSLTHDDWGKSFVLTADIDLGGVDWTPIGTCVNYYTESFTGTFDGQGHTIANLTYAAPASWSAGLFGCIHNAQITDINMTGGNVSGSQYVGLLVGINEWSTISNCHVSGEASGTAATYYGATDIGLLAGSNWYGTVTRCSSTGLARGDGRVGGLVGDSPGSIRSCFSSAQITGTASLGGLVGVAEGDIANCYSSGAVRGDSTVGGLVGDGSGSVVNCYSSGPVDANSGAGGLVGYGQAVNSFWDKETSGQTWSAGGRGRTTSQMKTAANYAGWNADGAVWTIDDGNDYPRLAWEGRPGAVIPPQRLGDILPGSGTETDPYLIYTAQQFNSIGLYAGQWNAHYSLMADIDMSAVGGDEYNVIGLYVAHPFTGTFEGNGHTVSNLTCQRDLAQSVGAFGYLSAGGRISGLRLADVNATGFACVGGLVGTDTRGVIADCHVTGVVKGDYEVGGLVGAHASGSVTGCSSDCTVSGNYGIGSLVGGIGYGTVSGCMSRGDVSGEGEVGGLAGYNYGTVENCYSSASVTASIERCGGLLGSNSNLLRNCYSTGRVVGSSLTGGLAGVSAVALNSFWDMETSGLATSGGGKGRTSLQMKSAANYLGWNSDGAAIWTIDDGADYPHLAWEGMPGEAIPATVLGDTVPGSGTDDDPYLISDAWQFNAIGLYPAEWDAAYRMTCDIDMSGLPAGDYNIIGAVGFGAFTGVFDGGGHTISGLTYAAGDSDGVGLFGVSSGRIEDLGLVDANVVGGSRVGTLVGENSGEIRRCYARGSVGGSEWSWQTGGLTGINLGTMSECYAACTVTGREAVGGLVGESYGVITCCYADGTVSGESRVGGLAGVADGGYVSQCYSRASVSGSDWTGGLVGMLYAELHNCYATGYVAGGSGLAPGRIDGLVFGCFWDAQTTGDSQGKTTAQMQDIATFLNAGWDFFGEPANGTSDYWQMPAGGGYPVLAPLSGNAPHEPEGSGSPDDPYIIADAWDLGSICYRPSACYRLSNDIDLTGIHWSTAVAPMFDGRFDGGGFDIINLAVTGGWHAGLFGRIDTEGSVQNLGIANCLIGGSIEEWFIGGLAGENLGTVRDCHASGTVHASGISYCAGVLVGHNAGSIRNCRTEGAAGGFEFVGGLAGDSSGEIVACRSMAAVSGTNYIGGLIGGVYDCNVIASYADGPVQGVSKVGGLVGRNGASYYEDYAIDEHPAFIRRSWSSGAVTGSDNVGGLAGQNCAGAIEDCYSVSQAGGITRVGGLTGANGFHEYEDHTDVVSSGYIRNSYSTGLVTVDEDGGGGLVGVAVEGQVTGSFWDVVTSGYATSGGGTGLSTAQMKDVGTFLAAGWDFVGESDNGSGDAWRLCQSGAAYPRLAWEFAAVGDLTCPNGVDNSDLAAFADQWLAAATIADTNADEVVNFRDFATLAGHWMEAQ